MKEKTFASTFDGVDGGPCPTCHLRGLLLADRGVYGGERTILHTIPGGDSRECEASMAEGWIKVSPAGVWSFRPHEDETDA